MTAEGVATVTETAGQALVDKLYKVRKGHVEFVDVPDLGFVMIDGAGAPGGAEFTDALGALYAVSYGAHFAEKKATGEAPRVMPLEALWWVDGEEAQAIMQRLVVGEASIEESDHDQWRWRAMIMQLPPIDEAVIERAIAAVKAKKPLRALGRVRYERWAEGPSAQIMHIGPYATEAASVVALHQAIAEHGSQPRGHHHEIYLGDPRTCAPEKLRTLLRQPIEPRP